MCQKSKIVAYKVRELNMAYVLNFDIIVHNYICNDDSSSALYISNLKFPLVFDFLNHPLSLQSDFIDLVVVIFHFVKLSFLIYDLKKLNKTKIHKQLLRS